MAAGSRHGVLQSTSGMVMVGGNVRLVCVKQVGQIRVTEGAGCDLGQG